MAKKKAAEKESGGAISSVLGMGGRMITGVLMQAGRMLPLCIILGGAAYGVLSIWDEAMGWKRFQIHPDQERAALKGEIPQDLHEELTKAEARLAGRSLLDPNVLEDLRKAYAKSPWIYQTCAFRRDFPNHIRADFTLRTPAAQAEWQGKYLLVDNEGVVLPTHDAGLKDKNLPVIYCKLANRPSEGQIWRSAELADALSVVRCINQSKVGDRIAIAAVKVNRSAWIDNRLKAKQTNPIIELKTTNGAFIRWGTNRATSSSEELSNAEKLEMLYKAVNHLHRFSEGDLVDVRTKTVSYSTAQFEPGDAEG